MPHFTVQASFPDKLAENIEVEASNRLEALQQSLTHINPKDAESIIMVRVIRPHQTTK